MSLSRRRFLRAAALSAGLPLVGRSGVTAGATSYRRRRAALPTFRIRTLTTGPKHHFFGYYGMPPWNASGRKLVCLESPFQHRLPEAHEPGVIGAVDPETGIFTPLGETYAWNLQQGALLHWNPLAPETEVVFNDRRGGEIVAAVMDTGTGRKRYLPRAISGVSRTGRYALSLTYGRLARLRRVVGYAGVEDPNPDVPHPDDDGVFRIDLATGETELIVPIRAVYELLAPRYPALSDRHMWFNHTVINPSNDRFFFLARTPRPEGGKESAMITARMDGSDLREVVPYGLGVSHFDWRSDREIIATFRHAGGAMKHVLLPDAPDPAYRLVGDGFLVGDGHCTFAPGSAWLATDRKHADVLAQSLWLYNVETEEGLVLTMQPMKERRYLHGDTRCDFHPRWNRTGTQLLFDALDTTSWTRQLHLVTLDFPGA